MRFFMGKKVDYEKEIVGKKINRLIIKDIVRTKGKETKALCDCECGTTDIVVSIYRLTKGLTKSCGCLSKEMSSKQGKKNHKTNKYDCCNEFCVGYTSCGKEFFFDKDDYKKNKRLLLVCIKQQVYLWFFKWRENITT